MRYVIFILCLVQFQVHASDWLNRTVRVDLIVNRKAFDPQHDLFERSERISSGVNATNGQYPWSILTTAWSDQGSGIRIGVSCSGTIIGNNFVISDLNCVGRDFNPPANSIEAFVGAVQWSSPLSATNFVRNYWYINSSLENSPNIALFRLHETLTFSPNVQPIRLPSHGNFSYEAWSSYILGFQTRDGLFSAHTSIFDNSACSFLGSIDEHDICGMEGSDPYENGTIRRFNAFTGGAWIVFEYTAGFEFIPVVVGIHQYQFANRTASYGHATRVSPFVEWIETLAVFHKEFCFRVTASEEMKLSKGGVANTLWAVHATKKLNLGF